MQVQLTTVNLISPVYSFKFFQVQPKTVKFLGGQITSVKYAHIQLTPVKIIQVKHKLVHNLVVFVGTVKFLQV